MTVIQAISETAKALENLSKALVEAENQSKKEVTDTKAAAEASKVDEQVKEETSVTIEMIRAVLAEKSQEGLTAEVKSLLESFGANKLSAVKAEDYAALLAAAKKI